MKATVSFSLDTEADHDILRWLNSRPRKQRSRAIREALRAHIGRSGVTLADVYHAIQELRREGLQVATQGQASPHAGEPPRGSAQDAPADPPDGAAALDRLGV